MNILSRAWGWIKNLFVSKTTIEQKLNVKVLLSHQEQNDIIRYSDIYAGTAEWNNKDVVSLRTARNISSEIASNVTIELETEVQGNDYINEQYQKVTKELRRTTEKVLASGGIIFRPFPYRGKMPVNISMPLDYFPLRYSLDGKLEKVCFVEFTEQQEGNELKKYMLAEVHDWIFEEQIHHIYRHVYLMSDSSTPKNEVPITSVSIWAELLPEASITASRPHFVTMFAPSGKPIFEPAIELIRKLDEHERAIEIEVRNARQRVIIDRDYLERDEKTGKLVESTTDIFEPIDAQDVGVTVYTPDIRMQPLLDRKEDIKREIENAIVIGHGRYSKSLQVQKTATEIESGNQPFYVIVKDYQDLARESLEQIVIVMSEIATAMKEQSDYADITWKPGDSILVTEEEKQNKYSKDITTILTLQGAGELPRGFAAAYIDKNNPELSSISLEAITEATAKWGGLPDIIDNIGTNSANA